MSGDWETYRNLPLVVNVVLRNPSTHETVTFQEGDDPPEWARRLMGPHVYGLGMPPEPFTWGDGLPMRVDLVCNECASHKLPRPVASLEPVTLLEEAPTKRFLWEERRTKTHNTRPSDGAPLRWAARTTDKAGRVHPGREVIAPWERACCGLKLETKWDWLCDRLDDARAAGVSRLDLRNIVYARTRKL